MTTTRSANAQAAVVSSTLRRAGIRPLPSGTPRGREGVRVSRGVGGATIAHVSVLIDSTRERKSLTDDVAAALTAAGYNVERGNDDAEYGFCGLAVTR